MLSIQLGLLADLEALFAAARDELPDVEQLCHAMPSLMVGRDIAAEQRFHHWPLVFSELLGPPVEGMHTPRGIDLMAGNPPWVKIGWNDAALLNEMEPKLGVEVTKSAGYHRARTMLLESADRRAEYHRHFVAGEGLGSFLNNHSLYPNLAGVQTNLYKNFIERSWSSIGEEGVAGLLHPEGVDHDPKGGGFRQAYYRRLKGHYQFKNELLLFRDIGNRNSFSLNIYKGVSSKIEFTAIFNLFSPSTIEACRSSQLAGGLLPGIKTRDNAWENSGSS